MSLKHITVNGKDLQTFDKYDGTTRRAVSRRLLAYDDAVRNIGEGGGADITVWLDADAQTLHWEAPDGYQIRSISTFETGAVAVDIVAKD